MLESKYNYIILISIILISCRNSDNNNKLITNSAALFPTDLTIKSNTHELILNTELFNQYTLKRNETITLNTEVSKKDIVSSTTLFSKIKFSKIFEGKINSDKTKVNFELRFNCLDCKEAYLWRYDSNADMLKSENQIKKWLQDPKTIDTKCKNQDGSFYKKRDVSMNSHGFQSFYLILLTKNDKPIVYELGAILNDFEGPKFIQSEVCSFSGSNLIDGLVCLETKHFGGSYIYDIPIKGYIHGDIDKLYIDNKRINFKKGEFFKRIKKKLITGYNQIPIKCVDRFDNSFESYIELSISMVEQEPNIYIDNDIKIDN